MAESITGNIGPFTSAADGQNQLAVLQGRSGELVVAEGHGKYYTQAYRGQVFHGGLAVAGAALPISTSTAIGLVLWNPLNSGVNVVPIKFRAGYASGTGVCTAIGYMALLGAGAAPINAVITAVTGATVTGGKLGAGGSKAICGTAATIVTATAVFLRSAGISQGAPITSTATVFNMVDDFDGEVILAPGSAIYPAGLAASGELLQQSISWYELPV